MFLFVDKLCKYARCWLCVPILLLASCATHRAPSDRMTSNPLQTIVSQSLPLQHGNIEYYQVGNHGSPMILIAGYGTDVSSWNKPFISRLASDHQLYLVNNRYVGRSASLAKTYNTKEQSADIHQLVKQLHLKKVAVLGISMGGMIAQQYAIQYPETVDTLILINTEMAGKQSVHPAPDVEKAMFNMPESKLGRYFLARRLFFPPADRWRMSYALIADRFQPMNDVEIDFASVQTKQRALILDWLNDDRAAQALHTLRMPVLVLNGLSDSVIPPINSELLAKSIPRARLVRWQGGGHAMIYQYPAEIAQTINEFLSRAF